MWICDNDQMVYLNNRELITGIKAEKYVSVCFQLSEGLRTFLSHYSSLTSTRELEIKHTVIIIITV